MNRIASLFPALVVAGMAAWLASKAIPPKPAAGGVDYYALGQIPIRDGGRVMPLDTLARSALQAVSGRTEIPNDGGRAISAVEWFTEVADNADYEAGKANDLKVIRIENDQLLGALELPRRPGSYRYSLNEVRLGFPRLQKAADEIKKKRQDGRPLDLYDAKIEELFKKLHVIERLNRLGGPRQEGGVLQVVPPQSAADDWTGMAEVDQDAQTRLTDADLEAIKQRALARVKRDFQANRAAWERLDEDAQMKRLDDMFTRAQAAEARALAADKRGDVNPAAGAFTRLIRTARDNNADAFKAALAEYNDRFLAHVPAGERDRAATEAYAIGHAAPFYHLAFVYLFVVVLTSFGWLVWTRPLTRAAFALGLFALAVHTVALGVRMYVQGRPPVTNLYSSAVFIGWGAVGLCLLIEWYYKNGIGNFVAGLTGAATLEVAHFLASSGDTMGNLVAVLDTNFWLSTHVTTVTLGYTATFVAGWISILFLLRGVFTKTLTPAQEKTLSQQIYGVVCFATLLSFVGTVLGGIWADYSWGRFWGWDPKENGAVMIVIWNALILHARWGGMVKNRGMAVLAVVGNMITAWSWFGTNQLQIGLHSYGFDDRLATGCRWFWYSQLAVIAVGLIPRKHWRSFGVKNPTA